MSEKLSSERSVRLLRAKAAELEIYVKDADFARVALASPHQIVDLMADIALVAGLLADHIERSPGPSGPELGDIDDANVRDMRDE
jgi:hypothetical protein